MAITRVPRLCNQHCAVAAGAAGVVCGGILAAKQIAMPLERSSHVGFGGRSSIFSAKPLRRAGPRSFGRVTSLVCARV